MQGKKIPKLVEIVFDLTYLSVGLCISLYYLLNSSNHVFFSLYGYMGLFLILGDSFHLIPRVIYLRTELKKQIDKNSTQEIDQDGIIKMALGFGKCITSISMTYVYVFLFYIYKGYFNESISNYMYVIVWLLLGIRTFLCLYPRAQWTQQDHIMKYNIMRNIPFVILGIIVMYYYGSGMNIAGNPFRYMSIAICFSFIFYLPVALFSKKKPKLGMLMIPKTIMYVWILLMGLWM